MNTTSTSTRTQSGRSQQRQSQQSKQGLSIDNLRTRLEEHVRTNPVAAVGQAVAVGYVLRFLPLRAMLSTGLRLAAPLMILNEIRKRTGLFAGQNGQGSGSR